MMPEFLQNILIILIPMLALIDNRGITIINHWPVTVGLLAGLVMGDLESALVIAGTFQLMSLGVAALGRILRTGLRFGNRRCDLLERSYRS